MVICNMSQIIIDKIDILALLGISILMPDMPVTAIFVQSMIILLKIQHLVSILTLSFGIGQDKQIFVGK